MIWTTAKDLATKKDDRKDLLLWAAERERIPIIDVLVERSLDDALWALERSATSCIPEARKIARALLAWAARLVAPPHILEELEAVLAVVSYNSCCGAYDRVFDLGEGPERDAWSIAAEAVGGDPVRSVRLCLIPILSRHGIEGIEDRLCSLLDGEALDP